MLHVDPAQVDDAAIEDCIIEGATDCAFGKNPIHVDNAAYMNGWLQELKQRLKAGDTLQIRWLSYAYMTGGYDSPDERNCEGEW